jgi:hypothetical protein
MVTLIGKSPGRALANDPIIKLALMECLPHHYQTRQALTLAMGWPALQENARWNSAEFCTTPLTRNLGGECGSVWT